MSLVSERVGQFFYEDHRLEYTEYGSGDRWVLLLHGQLMPRRMHQPLARKLAAAGAHVLTLDLLGHGRSDRPDDPLLYSMTEFGAQAIALLDELHIDRAVIGGTSLGANVSLEVAVAAPDRVQGLVIEMPVLDNGLDAGLVAFVPLMFAGRYFPLPLKVVRRMTKAVPRGVVPFWAGIVLDTMNQRPKSMAATLHGIIFGRIAPSAKQRMAIETPTLVVGHSGDPVHHLGDAEMLADEIATSTYVRARSLLEWRLRPQRLDAIALEFVDDCFAGPAQGRRLQGT